MKTRARKLYPKDPAARLADNLCSCSGPCCGNPRRHNKEITLQERRALSSMHAQIDDGRSETE